MASLKKTENRFSRPIIAWCMELSAILLTFIKLPFVIKILVLSIFEWPLYTGFTVIKSTFDIVNIVQFLYNTPHYNMDLDMP